jgi:hypothetical protein
MKMTQQDYDARKARVDAGQGDDEDARLVKEYERQGFTPGRAAAPAAPEPDAPEPDSTSDNAQDSPDSSPDNDADDAAPRRGRRR